MSPPPHRNATLVISLLGALVNSYGILQIVSLWLYYRRDVESEWEGLDVWRMDAARSLGAAVVLYMLTSATISCLGVVGTLKRRPSYIRLFLQHSITDLFLSTFFAIFFGLTYLRTSLRSAACEELSRQPDLMRTLSEAGMNLENCESWLDNVVMFFMAGMVVLLIVRAQFTMTVSSFYKQLNTEVSTRRHQSKLARSSSENQRRIYLLPSRRQSIVYAPVHHISAEQAQSLDASEAFVSPFPPYRDEEKQAYM